MQHFTPAFLLWLAWASASAIAHPFCPGLQTLKTRETFIEVFLVLEFFLPSELNECKQTVFSSKLSFVNSYLMLEIIKFQIISDGIVIKKISH